MADREAAVGTVEADRPPEAVDRASAEAETARYQSALSEIRPGASLQQPTNEESATVEQILGMENTGTRQGDSLHSLFGKRSLKPNPTT